ncbi:MAG: hypothetical protein M3O06_01760 [Pseudomonadota bacterium]|nr:hypothetical protein [Pseudomonadota bacterium]
MNRLTSMATTLAAGLALAGCVAGTAASQAAAAQTFYVYRDGDFAWPGDYSFVATANYRDTTGAPLSGKYDIKITIDAPWGGWQPYATNWVFDTSPYTYLRFSLKPTVADQILQVYFMLVGDKPVGVGVDPFKYGPPPVPGQWGHYVIPLADIGVAGTKIYKFAIQDKTGRSSNVFYIDDVAFASDAAGR